MIEVHKHLFVGTQQDYEDNQHRLTEWTVIHACKEPYHRQALGYSGRAASKDHPEYLIARRGNRLILNLVDANDPAYISDEIMDTAVACIQESLNHNQSVLVHCNLGQSRSPSIAMLYLGTHTEVLPRSSFDLAVEAFRKKYPPFAPAGGVFEFLRNRWTKWA
jgi:hypothetical protein